MCRHQVRPKSHERVGLRSKSHNQQMLETQSLDSSPIPEPGSFSTNEKVCPGEWMDLFEFFFLREVNIGIQTTF